MQKGAVSIQDFLIKDKSKDNITKKSRDLYIKYLKTLKHTNIKIAEIGEISDKTVARALMK